MHFKVLGTLLQASSYYVAVYFYIDRLSVTFSDCKLEGDGYSDIKYCYKYYIWIAVKL